MPLPVGRGAELKQTGQQGDQGGADQTDATACHQLLHALGLGTG